jgi:hypothetical protein
MQLYRPMLKTALSITWRFKYLWFFGLFAALLGNEGAFNLGVKNLNKVESQAMWLTNFRRAIDTWHFNFSFSRLSEMLKIIDIWGVLLICLILAVSIFLLWLAVSSQGALVYGARQALRDKTGLFSEAIKRGSSKFWPVLLLNILLNLAIFVSLGLVSLPFVILFIGTSAAIWQSIVVVLSFIVLVPLAIVLSLIMRYALIYIVAEDKHLGEAIGQAWHLFIKNWIVSLETGLLLFLLNILTGLALVIIMIFVALPFVILGMIAGQVAMGGLLWLVVTLGILTFIILMFLYAATWNVFQMTTWVILFEKISSGSVYSKLLRWAVWLTSGKKEEGEEEV